MTTKETTVTHDHHHDPARPAGERTAHPRSRVLSLAVACPRLGGLPVLLPPAPARRPLDRAKDTTR